MAKAKERTSIKVSNPVANTLKDIRDREGAGSINATLRQLLAKAGEL